MLLRELKNTESAGTYVAVVPTPSTLALLQVWAQEQNLQIVDDLHVTLLYSRAPINVVLCKDEFIATGVHLEVLGGCLVLRLDCPAMIDRHEQFISQGGTHDFPSFNLHMTLQKDTYLNPEDITLPNFGLVFANEYTEELKP